MAIPGSTPSPVSGGLNAVQFGVSATSGHELVVRADFRNSGAVEHDDEVGHANGAEAVRHKNRDAAVCTVAACGRGVTRALRSCHTATVNGYTIEGHVPAAEI